jgi:hypothetical protein
MPLFRTFNVPLAQGPEYFCLAGMLLVGAVIVVISFYFGFWGRK